MTIADAPPAALCGLARAACLSLIGLLAHIPAAHAELTDVFTCRSDTPDSPKMPVQIEDGVLSVLTPSGRWFEIGPVTITGQTYFASQTGPVLVAFNLERTNGRFELTTASGSFRSNIRGGCWDFKPPQ